MADIVIKVTQVGVKEAASALDGLNKRIDKVNKSKVTVETSAVKKGTETVKESNKALKAHEGILESIKKNAYWYFISGGVAAATKVFKDAIATMKEVDSQLVTVRKVTNATAEEMKALEDQAYKTASAYGVTADQYLSSVAAFARAGYKNQSADLAELAVKTQLVGDVSEDVANQFLLSVDAAYQLNGSVTELSKVLDGANEIDNNYATSIEKIAEGLGIIAPVAAQAHVGIDELSAALGTITAVTQRSGSEAARALRALFLNIMGDTTTEIEDGATWTAGEIEGLRDVIKQYAADAYEAAEATGSVINPMEAIAGLSKSMKDGLLTEQQLMSMVSDIGGKLRTSQLLAIVENWDTVYEPMLQSFNNSVGSADKEVTNALDSWDAKLNILKNTWTEFVQNTVDTEWIKGILDGVTALIQAVGNLWNAFVIVGGVIATIKAQNIIGWLSTVKTSIAEFVSLAKEAGGGLKGIRSAFGALKTSASSANLAVGILAATVTGAILLIQHFQRQEQEQLEAAKEAAEAFQGETESLDALYDKISSEDTTRDELIASMTELNDSYENELSHILDVNEAREKGIELLKEEAVERAKQWRRENAGNVEAAKDYLNSTVSDKVLGAGTMSFDSVYAQKNWYERTIEEYQDRIDAGETLSKTESNFLKSLGDQYAALNEKIDTNEALVKQDDEALSIINGTYEYGTDAVDEYAEAENNLNEKIDSTLYALSEQNQALQKNIKAAGDAFAEFNENGSLSYSTLSDIQNAFSDVSGIDGYIAQLAQTGITAEEVKGVLSDLALAKIESTWSTEDLAGADVNLIAAMLDEAGVANSLEIATYAVEEAKIREKVASFDSIDAAMEYIDALQQEGKISDETRLSLVNLVAQQQIFSNSELNVAGKISALGQLAQAAMIAGSAMQFASGYTQYAHDYAQMAKAYGGKAISPGTDLTQQYWNQLVGKANSLLSESEPVQWKSGGSSGSSRGGSSGGGSSASSSASASAEDAQLEALKDRVSLLKAELSLLEAQDRPISERVAKQMQIMQAIGDQADYMSRIGADQEELTDLTTEWYNVLNDIRELQKDLMDELEEYIDGQLSEAADARDAAIEKLKAEQEAEDDLLTLEEKRKAVLEAQNALLSAQEERTVRIYNAATGQWEWVANAASVKSAQDALDEAKKNLADYEKDQALQEEIDRINAAYDAIEERWNKLKEERFEEKDRTAEEIVADLFKTFGTSDITGLVWNNVNPLLEALAAFTGSMKKYDSGGVLHGMGGIKATSRDEIILPPEIAEKMLAPAADQMFRSRVSELAYLYGTTPRVSPPMKTAASSSYSIGTQNNGAVYNMNGYTLTAQQAKSMTVYDFVQMSRGLGIYNNT